VTVKKTILFKKISAVFLLLQLFGVIVIQISHSHSTSSVSAAKIRIAKSGLTGYNTSVGETKCFICEYQLSKDIDTSLALFQINRPASFCNKPATLYVFTSPGICSVFETRGPPHSA